MFHRLGGLPSLDPFIAICCVWPGISQRTTRYPAGGLLFIFRLFLHPCFHVKPPSQGLPLNGFLPAKCFPEFVFSFLQYITLALAEIVARTIDVEIEHAHCRLQRATFSTLAFFGGAFERGSDFNGSSCVNTPSSRSSASECSVAPFDHFLLCFIFHSFGSNRNNDPAWIWFAWRAEPIQAQTSQSCICDVI